MQRKLVFYHGLATDGCVYVDPTHDEVLEGVYKKNIREGEEKLMLAVLESAVEDFQTHLFARPLERNYFNKPRNGF